MGSGWAGDGAYGTRVELRPLRFENPGDPVRQGSPVPDHVGVHG